MTILTSLFLGAKGSYNIHGIEIEYKEDPNCKPPSLKGAGAVSSFAKKCLNNFVFRVATQGYLHVFVHEMGHALLYQLFTGENPKIIIKTDTGTAITAYPSNKETASWKRSAIQAAGTLGSVAFSVSKLAAVAALKDYLPWPVTLIQGGGAVMWISGELLYTYVSVKEERADFGKIAKTSKTHLAIATAALASEVALGTYVVVNLTV